MFRVTKVDKTNTVETTPTIKHSFVAEAAVPTDAPGNQPRIPYQDEVFPFKVTKAATTEADSFEKEEYLKKVFTMPRSDFRQPKNSQYYVILNGSVQGKFMNGSTQVTDVTNIHLLQIGDFVNQDYVPSGTRIKGINPSDSTIELTKPVKLSSTLENDALVDHVPFCYVSPGQR